MSRPIHIAAMSGSLRSGSYNTALLREAQRRLPEGATMEIVPIRDLPLFDADLEAEGVPEAVDRMRRSLAVADAFLFASPEYNFSITAALKNALDWASRGVDSPLNGKTAAIMGAGGKLGTARSQFHLREILMHNRIWVLPGPEVLVQGASRHFDDELRLIDPRLADRVGNLVTDLVDTTRRLTAEMTPAPAG